MVTVVLALVVAALAVLVAITSDDGDDARDAGAVVTSTSSPDVSEPAPLAGKPSGSNELTTPEGTGPTGELQEAWRFPVRCDLGPLCLIAVADDAVFARVETDDGSAVVGLDAETGEQRWERPTTPEEGLIPWVVGDQLLLGGANTELDPTPVELVDRASGAPVWSIELGRRATPFALVGDDTVLFQALDVEDVSGNDPNRAQYIAAVDLDSGKVRWTKPSTAPLSSCGGLVYVVAAGKQDEEPDLQAVDVATGEVAWTFADDRPASISRWACTDDGKAVILRRDRGDDDLDEGYATPRFEVTVHAPEDGSPVWSADLDELQAGQAFAANGDVVVTGGSTSVVAFDGATGEVRWQVPADMNVTGEVVLTDDRIVIAATGTLLRLLDLRTGDELAVGPPAQGLVQPSVDLFVVGDRQDPRRGITALDAASFAPRWWLPAPIGWQIALGQDRAYVLTEDAVTAYE